MQILGNRLLVTPMPVLQSTGGIHYAPSHVNEANIGGPKLYRVLAVGPGRKTKKGVLVPIEAQPGDRILCHSYTDGPVSMPDGQSVISADQVLAVFPKGAA